VYALDGTEAQHRPYTVTEHTYTIELLQPGLQPRPDGPQNYHAVFLTHSSQTVTAQLRAGALPADGGWRADPRISHDLVLAVDDYGNPLRTVSSATGAGYGDPEHHDAERTLITNTVNTLPTRWRPPVAHRTSVAVAGAYVRDSRLPPRAGACSGSPSCAMSSRRSKPSCPSRTGSPAGPTGPRVRPGAAADLPHAVPLSPR